MVLNADSLVIGRLWHIDEHFSERRDFLVARVASKDGGPLNRGDRVAVDEAVAAPRASVSQSFLEQRVVNDPLIIAAIAVLTGISSDRNQVGASALSVFFDQKVAKTTTLADLRALLG